MNVTKNKIKQLKTGKKIHDGRGLYFFKKGDKGRWSFRYQRDGRCHEMGCGTYPEVSIAMARELRESYKKMLSCRVDPITEKRKEEAKRKVIHTSRFSDLAKDFIEEKKFEWRNTKHRKQWASTLETYAYKILDSKPIEDIEVQDVMRVLKPIWVKKTVTAQRVMQRIAKVMGKGKSLGLYHKDNPAIWKGNLEFHFGDPFKINKVRHHPAMPYKLLPTFYKLLMKQSSLSSYALRLLILTVARTNEILGARRDEFDLQERRWTVPEHRMKANREHKVPLSDEAIDIIQLRMRESNHELLFPSVIGKKHISNMAMLELMRRQTKPYNTFVPHGFRSSFRDWAAETGNYDQNVVEFCMAHKLHSRVEGAYMRSDLYYKRVEIMNDWEKLVVNG